MISHRRLDRIAKALPPSSERLSAAELEQLDVAAARAGRWSWAQARRLLENYLDGWRDEILRRARQTRMRRQRQNPAYLRRPVDLAAEIVSYAPGETPPAGLAQAIEDRLYELDRSSGDTANFMVLDAAACMLILGTPDGMALRQALAATENSNKRRRRRRRVPKGRD